MMYFHKWTIVLFTLFSSFLSLQNVYAETTDLLILSDKNRYYSGEVVTISVVSQTVNTNQEIIHIDLVSTDGNVLFCDYLTSSYPYVSFELPDELKTGYYRIVANKENVQPALKYIEVVSSLSPETGKVITEKQISDVQIRSESKRLKKGISEFIYIQVTDGFSSGVSEIVSVFNQKDSLLGFIKTNELGLGQIRIDSNWNAEQIQVKVSGKKASLMVFSNLPVYQIATRENDTLQVRYDVDSQADLKIYKTIIYKNDVLEFISDLETLKLSNFLYKNAIEVKEPTIWRVVLDSAGTQLQESVFISTNSNSDSNLVQTTVYPEGVIQLSQKSQEICFTAKIMDNSIDYLKGNDLICDVWAQKYGFHEFPSDRKDVKAFYLFHNFNTFNSSIYYNEHIAERINCAEYKGKFISYLMPETWSVIRVPCDSISFADRILRKKVNQLSHVLGYSFETNRNHIKKMSYKQNIAHHYPNYDKPVFFSNSVKEQLTAHKDRQFIQRIYNEKRLNEKSKLSYNKTLRLKDYYLTDRLSTLLMQIDPDLKIKTNSNYEITSLQVYPDQHRNPFPYSPLVLINDIPTFDFDVINQLDIGNVDSISIMNTYTNFKTLGDFGRNGVLAFYLKLGAENPLEKSSYALETIHKSIVPAFKKTDSIDLRPILDWKVYPVMDKESETYRFDFPDYNSNFTLRIQGFTKDKRFFDIQRNVTKIDE